MKKIQLYIVLLGLFGISQARELFDRVAVVVDEDIIMESEIQTLALQFEGRDLSARAARDSAQATLIQEKVIFAKARIDTLFPSPTEVETQVNAQIEQMAAGQNVSVERLGQMIQNQMGMGLADFKKRVLSKQFLSQNVVQKIRGKYVGRQEITPAEVRAYFESKENELPSERNSYELSRIVLPIVQAKARVDSVRSRADSVLQELRKGAKFEDLVAKYSEDESTKEIGGDLGFFKKGALQANYESVAFRLDPGQWGDRLVLTDDGYHLIKLLERKDLEARTAHVLFKLEPLAKDTARVMALADSLKSSLTSDISLMDSIVVKYSKDRLTQESNGRVGWTTLAKMDPKYREVLQGKTSGFWAPPIVIDRKVHLIHINRFETSRTLNLKDDWNTLQTLTQNFKAAQKLSRLVEAWKKEIYIEVR
jgi:peptidyl-prolyl cis-trans isomerase SurA